LKNSHKRTNLQQTIFLWAATLSNACRNLSIKKEPKGVVAHLFT